jgi:hypothetical protein
MIRLQLQLTKDSFSLSFVKRKLVPLLAVLQRFREHFPFAALQRVIPSIGVVLIAASVLWAAWTLFA